VSCDFERIHFHGACFECKTLEIFVNNFSFAIIAQTTVKKKTVLLSVVVVLLQIILASINLRIEQVLRKKYSLYVEYSSLSFIEAVHQWE